MENKTNALKGEELMLVYKVHQPVRSQKKPGLILLLHGIGSNEEDLFRLANRFPPDFVIVSARAPYTISNGKYTWFELGFNNGERVINAEQAEKSRLVINTFISQLIDKYDLDSKKVFLGGFSQGGIMSYSVGLTFPKKLAGIFILSSRLLPEVKPLIRSKEELQSLPIFIAHGKNDPVLPLAYAHDALAYLKPMTNNITYNEYDMVHTLGDKELGDLVDWILLKSL
ncbi:esterase [Mucilaginibacter sp. ZT4R22]|uniref:Esterase n=1 Tax=Mucilaginibacter pankratovii TaxID=2772110 RepID=A0ABR7WMP9_9SPHI|nr:esterase [Mucilaginibacter pankratovii]MBD1362597.1 esterase [Mucilaginibacter pankratovii]